MDSDENSFRSNASSVNFIKDEESQEEEESLARPGSGGDVLPDEADDDCSLDSLSLIGVEELDLYERPARTILTLGNSGGRNAPEDLPHEEEEDIIALAPEHPLLVNFHQSVLKHLTKQKEQLAHDIRELAAKVKNQRHDSDNLAEKLYGVQQTVNRQHAVLDVKTENATNNAELREELQKCMKDVTDEHRNEMKYLSEAQSFEETLWRKLGLKTEKDNEVRKNEEKAEMKLALLKRQTEKATWDKKTLIEEKKLQDEFVYRLTCQITDLQGVLAQIHIQIAAKRKESSQLEQAVKGASKDLEEQKMDHHRLNQVWQRLLVTAKIKDVEAINLQSKQQSLQEMVKITENTTTEHKKGEDEEKRKNEELLLIYKRVNREKKLLELHIAKILRKIEELHEKTDKTNNMINLTEADLKNIKKTNQSKESKISFLENEMTRLLQAHLDLEKKILEALNEKTIQDKSVQDMIKKVDALYVLLEQLDKDKIHKDTQLAQAELEVQRLRHEEAQLQQYLNQQIEQVKCAQNEISSTESELQAAQTELSIKQGKLNKLNIKLSKHLERTGGQETSPLETKITDMEDQILALSENIKTNQRVLLRKEVIIADKNDKISKLKNNIEHLLRNVENMQHKSRGQIDELEKLQVQGIYTRKKTDNQVLALSSVNKEIASQKASKQVLEKDSILHFNDIQTTMKEEEQRVLELTEKLAIFGETRKQLYEELRMQQAQQVDLEAKLSLANETKQAIEHERGSQGEIAAMRNEIHRMEVRLGQLKRAQEKLKMDFDQCVLRRDAMVDSARVRNTKHSVANTAKLKLLRRLETVKYNNKQLISKIEKYATQKVSLKVIEQEIQGLNEELEQKKSDIYVLSEPLKAVATKSQTLRNSKREKLERLVHEQKIFRGLSDAKEGRYKILCKSESALGMEAEKYRAVHSNLVSIIESLQPDFPQYGSQLQANLALLKSIKIVYPNLSAAQSIPETDVAASAK